MESLPPIPPPIPAPIPPPNSPSNSPVNPPLVLPPILSPIPTLSVETAIRLAYWRRALCLVLLVAYPLLLSVASQLLEEIGFKAAKGATLLPEDLAGLLLSGGENLLVFGLWFLLAAWIGGLRPRPLKLVPRPRPSSILWGLGWSIGLRMVIAIIAVAGIAIWMAIHGIKDLDAEFLKGIRPKVENLVAPESLRSPWYLFTNLTFISFVLAGFREELWRSGMIAAGIRLLPTSWRGRKGRVVFVVISSAVFGLAHLPQGWGGVVLTGILGLGLGTILLVHRSIWVAVLAHGFFDATTFLALWVLDHFGKLAEVLKG